MTEQEFVDKVVSRVKEVGDVTLAEVVQLMKSTGIEKDPSGDYVLESADNNIVYWTNLSDGASKLLLQVIQDKRLRREPTSKLTYLFEGSWSPNLPTVTAHGIKKGYKRPHWLPVVLMLKEES